MADNVTVRQGTGANTKEIAADDVAGVLYQRVKLTAGIEGSANDVSDVNPLPITGSITVSETVLDTVSTGTITTVASSTTSAQALAANSNRKGVQAINTDANAALIKYGTTASAASFTVRLVQYAQWEMPTPIYTGRIDVVWEGDGSGSLIVTET